jgi:hypothetical protein
VFDAPPVRLMGGWDVRIWQAIRDPDRVRMATRTRVAKEDWS